MGNDRGAGGTGDIRCYMLVAQQGGMDMRAEEYIQMLEAFHKVEAGELKALIAELEHEVVMLKARNSLPLVDTLLVGDDIYTSKTTWSVTPYYHESDGTVTMETPETIGYCQPQPATIETEASNSADMLDGSYSSSGGKQFPFKVIVDENNVAWLTPEQVEYLEFVYNQGRAQETPAQDKHAVLLDKSIKSNMSDFTESNVKQSFAEHPAFGIWAGRDDAPYEPVIPGWRIVEESEIAPSVDTVTIPCGFEAIIIQPVVR